MKIGPKLVWKNGWNMFFLTIKIIDFLYFQSSYFVEEDGKEYIYKEPKVTSLAEICERLKNMYSEKYGKDTVKLIMDSNKVLNPGLHVCILYILHCIKTWTNMSDEKVSLLTPCQPLFTT